MQQRAGGFGIQLDSDFEQLQNATIMMVDDEMITMEVVQTFLEDAGYRKFILIEDSTRAMDALREHRPDVLLLDGPATGLDPVAKQALVGGDAHLRALDLAVSGLPAQLPGEFAYLGDGLGRYRLAETGQPPGDIDRDPAAQGGVSPPQQGCRSSLHPRR